MKTSRQILISLGIIVLLFVFGLEIKNKVLMEEKTNKVENSLALKNEPIEKEEELKEEPEEVVEADPIVYDNMTMDELVDKLNRTLSSTLEGQGYAFASQSLELGIDPYLAVAIVMHETGCKWGCSNLVKSCNNVGGQKGGPSCGGGSYKSYPTLEEGIRGYLLNLYNGYISQGLTTPETIGPKYAASTSWSEKIGWYIEDIRSK